MKIDDMGDDMTGMETSITGLQDDLDIANKPAKKHFRPLWLLAAIVVVLLIGSFAFFSALRFIQVDENSQTIDKGCQFRNEQIEVINEKLTQLNILIDARLKDRPDSSPNPPEVVAAFEAFKKPIPLKSCEDLQQD